MSFVLDEREKVEREHLIARNTKLTEEVRKLQSTYEEEGRLRAGHVGKLQLEIDSLKERLTASQTNLESCRDQLVKSEAHAKTVMG
jgi:hypothetical protein